MTKEELKKQIILNAYLLYLKEWVDNHSELKDYGMSPACFEEWFDNGGEECL